MNDYEKHMASLRSDPRSTAELLDLALKAPDPEDEGRWDAIHILRVRATREVLDAAVQFYRSPAASERMLGADLLAQLGSPEDVFPEERFTALIPLLESEKDPGVLRAALFAAGQLGDARLAGHVLRYLGHADSEVRFAIAYSLGMLQSDVPSAVTDGLIQLCEDSDSEVRDWATFSLGSLHEPTPPDSLAVREALVRRLDDSDQETRGEAMVGLARRRDERVLGPLLQELVRESVPWLAVEAAREFGDPRLCPALRELKARLHEPPDVLDEAIERCCLPILES